MVARRTTAARLVTGDERAAIWVKFLHLGPGVAVICTHPHVDHYGGIHGLVGAEDVRAGRVAIIAPGRDFDAYALGENVTCGNVMSRRADHRRRRSGRLPPARRPPRHLRPEPRPRRAAFPETGSESCLRAVIRAGGPPSLRPP
ncbi:MBL fold metallo-hydrolase [Kitasatospora cineracea]|uniref:MBL fold metallo-hydrolase n=1 Tax=Kitasatospora cineracea TaxID=88074 RepID=UPI0033DB17D1